MKKTIFNLALFFFWSNCFSQIGINTTTPNAMLDISSTTNGLLIPRIALTSNNVESPVVNPQGGALSISTMIYNTATVVGINGVSPGYYYWNGSLWIPLFSPLSNDWKLNGNATISEPSIPVTYGVSTIGTSENFVGTTDAKDMVFGTNNIERFRIKENSGNIGIGTANPDITAKLQVETNLFIGIKSENTFTGNFTGYGIQARSVNNPGYGIGGAFTGGHYGVKVSATASSAPFYAAGVFSEAYGDGGLTATRVGGYFRGYGINDSNYGIETEASGGTNNSGGKFTATGGQLATGSSFYVSNGNFNIGGRFQVSGNSAFNFGGDYSVTGNDASNFGVSLNASGSNSTNYGGRFQAFGTGSTNYAGYFWANGGTTNTAGYFLASNGATVYDNKAIIVPPNGGLVGIGTNNPLDQLEIAGGYVRSTGYRCRTGTSGIYPGNAYNINWNGSSSQLWIDVTNVGTFQFTSDRRLKENILNMEENSLSRVMLLKPVSFNYKNIPNSIFTGSPKITEGFIADELQQIIPSAVNGEKDAITTEGTIQPQTINTAPIIAVLTKAIQEQQKIIESLESRLKTLENKK